MIEALKHQINALRAQERQAVKALQERFRALLHRDSLTERELQAERAALLRQERVALAMAHEPAQKRQVREHYEAMRGLLKAGVKLKEHEIRQLREMERAMIDHIRHVYGHHIRHLEAQIRALR
jgi:hypothetical protein